MCRCEWTMRGFRSPETLQRFVSIFSALHNLFVPPRSRHSAFAIHLYPSERNGGAEARDCALHSSAHRWSAFIRRQRDSLGAGCPAARWRQRCISRQLPHAAPDGPSANTNLFTFNTSSSKHHKAPVRTHAVVLNIINYLPHNVALPSLR